MHSQGRAWSWCAVMALVVCCGCAADDAGADSEGDGGDIGMHDGSVADAAGPERDAAPPDGGEPEPRDGAVDDGGDHDGAPAADRTAPVLVASYPEDGDDDVAFDGPHTLEFSEPVLLADGALALHEHDSGSELSFTAELSDDGRSVVLSFDELPELPAQLTLELSDGITDLSGNPLEPVRIDFGLPIWQRLGGAVGPEPVTAATDVALAIDDQGRTIALSVVDGDVYASRFEAGAWSALGGALNEHATSPSAGAEPRVALIVDDAGTPLASFRDGTRVVVKKWSGTSWSSAGDIVDADGGGAYAPAIALGAEGEPVVAFDALGAGVQAVLRVRALQGSSWQTLDDFDLEARGVRLASKAGGEIVLAYQVAGGGISVSRWDGTSAFAALGSGPVLPAISGSFALSAADEQRYTLSAEGQGTVDWDAGSWAAKAEDLGFLISSQAAGRAIAHGADGALFAAFSETPLGTPEPRVYAQRFDGARFQPLGPPVNRARDAAATRPALAIDAFGKPIVAWLETPAAGGPSRVFVSRFNGAPEAPPYGLRRPVHTPCLTSPPADGSALADTGCFADAVGHEPIAGFVPFDVRSPLWSDGAFKRRFVLLPEGKSITYRDPGIWTLPEGTIVMKEFSIEARRGDPSTLRPVETRFLIVRNSGSWDRYSYQWNQAATAATLRVEAPATSTETFDIEDESGVAATQAHFFPSRAACLSCHQAPGTVLGLQTAMLNRNVDYGGTVDNQLRALQRIGVFGSTLGRADLGSARFMPNPTDTTYGLERRLRAYLHANCSSCHHPLAGMDLQIQTPTSSSGLCMKITKGDLEASVIYWRDVLRGNVGQPGTAPMPPLGTLTGNPVLETLLTDWILDPSNACP